MTWDLPALLPILKEGVLRIVIALKNPSPLTGFEPATFGFNGKHTNHYTTKATKFRMSTLLNHYSLVGCRALMMEAVLTSETSVYSNQTTRRYIPEGCCNLHF
jgi:hypothetical protein